MKTPKKEAGILSFTILQVVELGHSILKGMNHLRQDRGYRYVLDGSTTITHIKKLIARDRASFKKEFKCKTTARLDFVVIFNSKLERDAKREQKIASIFKKGNFPPSEIEAW
jgi:hypothetical protein